MMIVEIGTSDFRTQAGLTEGLFIEPVRYYYDRLPDDCLKENCAVSNFTGEIEMYYLTDREINQYGLPYWVRGCNSIERPHPSVIKLLNDSGINTDIIHMDIVPVARIADLISKHNIQRINILKIDTEGHDLVILKDFFNTVDILPRQIIFESNELSDRDEVNLMAKKLLWYGYHIKRGRDDIIATLKPE